MCVYYICIVMNVTEHVSSMQASLATSHIGRPFTNYDQYTEFDRKVAETTPVSPVT